MAELTDIRVLACQEAGGTAMESDAKPPPVAFFRDGNDRALRDVVTECFRCVRA